MKRLGIAALALLLSACGTTVPLAQQRQTISSGDGIGQGVDPTEPAGGSATSPGATTGTPDGTGDGTGDGIGTGTPQAGRGGSLPPGPSSGTSVQNGSSGSSGNPSQAVSTGPVRIGVLYITGADEVFSGLGISGVTTGDTKAQAKAVFDYVNKNGGLAGRRIVPSYYAVKAADSVSDNASAQQAGCTALTQDDHVQFVVTIVTLEANGLACFAKAGVPVLDDVAGLATVAPAVQKYLSAPGDFATSRLMKVLVDGLWRTGWLKASSKVGSYTYDTVEDKAVIEKALLPALQAHGLTLTERAAVSPGAAAANQASAAALKFRASGVDRIIPVIANPLVMMVAADSQGYTPEYAVYSSFGPGALIEGTAPKRQLEGAAGIGWQPYLDIGAGTHPGPVSARETLCFALMKAAGQASSSAVTKGLETNVCNVIFYLQFAAKAVGGVPPDLLSQAGARVGTSFAPSDTFRSDVTTRYDGAASYRDLAYTDSCSCFQYVGGLRAAD